MFTGRGTVVRELVVEPIARDRSEDPAGQSIHEATAAATTTVSAARRTVSALAVTATAEHPTDHRHREDSADDEHQHGDDPRPSGGWVGVKGGLMCVTRSVLSGNTCCGNVPDRRRCCLARVLGIARCLRGRLAGRSLQSGERRR